MKTFSFFQRALAALLLTWLTPSVWAAAAYPFPQATTYAYGFKPTNPATGTWASDYTTLQNKYNSWKAVHVVNGGGATLRISRDSADGFDTVSEGISYGMLLAVYFNDQATFDGLWGYKQSKNDGLGLMNWRVSSGGGITGSNSATDADEDIAFSLFLAHRQWGSGGALNYYNLATAELTKIRNYCLDNNRVKPGDAFNSCRYPSYFFPNEYRVFAIESGDSATWNSVRSNSYATIAAARNNTTGLIAEQTTDFGTGGGCGVSSSNYEYNSCRVPFRMAVDYVYYGDSNAATHLDKVTSFFGAITPGNVRDCYVVSNGSTCNGNNNAAFVGPAATGFMRTGGANLQTYYNYLMGMNHTNDYYSGAIQLLTLLLLQGNMPNIADPGAIYTPTPSRTPTLYAGTPTFTSTQTPIAFAYIFEDFEAGSVAGGYTYPGPGSTTTFAASTAQAHSPTYSDRMLVTVGVGGYTGHGFNSNYANGSGVVNMSGTNKVRFWIYTDKDLSAFRLSFREGLVSGGDDEVWQSPPINVFASPPGWKQVEVDISTFTEDIYNGSCNPTCLTAGNNVFNLASVKTAQFGFSTAVTAATIYVDDIAFVPSVAPSPTSTKTPFAQPYNQIFDDMEHPMSLSRTANRAGVFADTANGATSTVAVNSSIVASGSYSGLITFNSGNASSYGAGAFLISPYSTPGLYVDASGAVQMGFWMYSTVAGLKYKMAFQEAGTPTSPTALAEGEAYESSILTTGAANTWQWVEIDLATFNEDIYNPNCQPTCGTSGDGVKDYQAISSVTFKIQGNQGSGSVYFDDVNFVTTWKTPTPTQSASNTRSPTRTPSPSPSPSPTASGSPTFTASPSPSGTGTFTRTVTPLLPSPTPTATPTDTVVLPSPTSTDTPLPGSTFTNTSTQTVVVTATFSSSVTPPPTGTPTQTNGPSSTSTQTPLPGSSFTSTSTVTPPASPTSTQTPVAVATAMINDLGFTWTPNQLTVTAGTNVTWAWVGTHDLNSDTGLFTSGAAVAGGSFNYTFNTPGTYRYYCSLHGGVGGTGMSGIIYVTGGSTATMTPSHTPLASATATSSATRTPSVTPSATPVVAGPTATFTSTVTSGGSTPGTTPVAVTTEDTTATQGPILSTLPAPNPNPSTVLVQLNRRVDKLTLKIYSTSMIVIDSASSGPSNAGWAPVPIPPTFLQNATSGAYYYVVTAERNGSTTRTMGTGKLLILK